MSRRNQKRPQVYQKEFVRMLAATAMIPEYEAEDLVEIFLKTLVASLLQNRSVCFPAFGVFELREISERVGRNPRTMEEFVIPESLKPVFRPSKALRDSIAAYASSQKRAEPERDRTDFLIDPGPDNAFLSDH